MGKDIPAVILETNNKPTVEYHLVGEKNFRGSFCLFP
jgi:hypothetical protein